MERQEKKILMEGLKDLHNMVWSLVQRGRADGSPSPGKSSAEEARDRGEGDELRWVGEMKGWLSVLEEEVIEGRAYRTKLETHLKAVEERLRGKEKEVEAAQLDLEAVHTDYRRTVLYLRTKHRQLQARQVEVMGSNHDLQQMLCHLQSTIRYTKQPI